MEPWDEDDDLEKELESIGGGCGIEDLIGGALSFFAFASVVSWISEKLKDLFRGSD